VTCTACLAFAAAERAALEGLDIPDHTLTCTCEDDRLLDLLTLPAWRILTEDLEFRKERQIGVPLKLTWRELVACLAHAEVGDPMKYSDPEIAKRARGGYAGGLFPNGWRNHKDFSHTEIMTVDIDGHGEVARAAAAFASFRTAIHSTYKSARAAPRCRAVVLLAQRCTELSEYKRGHKAIRDCLYAWGYERADIDEGASDATRLNYWPMVQPGEQFTFAVTRGEPLDIARIPAPKPKPGPLASATRKPNPDKYREGALRRAEAAVRVASKGDRHATLFREAASLARENLHLSNGEIERALHQAFVAAAGEGRSHEGARTIADAIARGRTGT
jgi:hypothetical protein